MKYCILLSFHMDIKILNVLQTSPFCPYRVPDIATWSYQTRVFHLLIASWHIFPVYYFTLALFFAFSLICLSYINKSFVMKMSCILPRAKLQRVTFFVKWSYLLLRENFKLPYLPNQAQWDPGICSQLRSNHIYSIHQKSRDFINGNFVYFALICALWSSRGRAGKKVTAVTFIRCPTVLGLQKYYKFKFKYFIVAYTWQGVHWVCAIKCHTLTKTWLNTTLKEALLTLIEQNILMTQCS